jgi:CelD/BcsL family acetyltransferase involved in cellulose biosynthesis
MAEATAGIVDEVDGLRAVAAEWDALAVAARRPYAAPGWALAWWDHMRPAGADLRAVLVRDGGRMVAIAPLYAQDGRYAPLAGGYASNVEPLAEPGREAEVATAIAGALAQAEPRPRALVLAQQGAAPNWPALLCEGWPDAAPWEQLRATESSPWTALDGLDYDGWLAKRSGSFRRELRRKRKRLDAASARFRLATAETLERDVGELLRLHRARLERRGGTLLADDRNERVLVAAGRALLPADRLRLLSLEIDGAVVGSQLLVAAGGEVCAWNSGFDEAYSDYSPVMQCLLHALEDALARGDRRMSLGAGDNPYKQRLADAEDRLTSHLLLPRGRGHVRARAGAIARDRLRGLRRRLRR